MEQALGIDLADKHEDIRKILRAHFSGLIFAGHHNFDEVLQEIYKGLLIRNGGKCPWDQRKASLGRYTYMVCSCILRNYHRKEQGKREPLCDPYAPFGGDWEDGPEGSGVWEPVDPASEGVEDRLIDEIDWKFGNDYREVGRDGCKMRMGVALRDGVRSRRTGRG